MLEVVEGVGNELSVTTRLLPDWFGFDALGTLPLDQVDYAL